MINSYTPYEPSIFDNFIVIKYRFRAQYQDNRLFPLLPCGDACFAVLLAELLKLQSRFAGTCLACFGSLGNLLLEDIALLSDFCNQFFHNALN